MAIKHKIKIRGKILLGNQKFSKKKPIKLSRWWSLPSILKLFTKAKKEMNDNDTDLITKIRIILKKTLDVPYSWLDYRFKLNVWAWNKGGENRKDGTGYAVDE